MFLLAATLVGWIGGDLVYRKVAAKNRLFACGPTDATAIPIMSGLSSF